MVKPESWDWWEFIRELSEGWQDIQDWRAGMYANLAVRQRYERQPNPNFMYPSGVFNISVSRTSYKSHLALSRFDNSIFSNAVITDDISTYPAQYAFVCSKKTGGMDVFIWVYSNQSKNHIHTFTMFVWPIDVKIAINGIIAIHHRCNHS